MFNIFCRLITIFRVQPLAFNKQVFVMTLQRVKTILDGRCRWIESFRYLDYRVVEHVSFSSSFQGFVECIQGRLFMSSNLSMSRLTIYWDGCNNSNLSMSRLNSIRGTPKASYVILSASSDALIRNNPSILNHKYTTIPFSKKL